MDDRTLLELAAKAAGLDVEWHCPKDEVDEHVDYLALTDGMRRKGDRSPDNSQYWNPLTDDGDAFRLQTKLRFTVKVADHECEVFDEVSVECLASIPMFNPTNDEALTVTRRAITMAAAAIATRDAEKGE